MDTHTKHFQAAALMCTILSSGKTNTNMTTTFFRGVIQKGLKLSRKFKLVKTLLVKAIQNGKKSLGDSKWLKLKSNSQGNHNGKNSRPLKMVKSKSKSL